jgi:hypothetical protein
MHIRSTRKLSILARLFYKVYVKLAQKTTAIQRSLEVRLSFPHDNLAEMLAGCFSHVSTKM